jgi:iron complex transport system permease protein
VSTVDTRVEAGAGAVSGLLPGSHLLTAGPVTLVVHRRTLVADLALLAVLAAVSVLYLASGQVAIPFGDVVRGVFGAPIPDEVVLEVLRLPRLAAAVVAGLAFGLAGALIQGVLRNPLASPDVIGVTHGASAVVVGVFTFGLSTQIPVEGAALGGGLVAAALVYLLAWQGGVDPGRFLLIGIGLAAGLAALSHLLLTKGDFMLAEQAKVWTVGTLNGRGYDAAVPLLVVLMILLPVLVWAGSAISAAAFDDATVTALGGRPQLLRGGLALLGVVLAALATAAVGPVNFVALLAPPIARLVTRRPTVPLLASGLVGALVVTAADLAGRTVFLPFEVAAGVLTALVGAPYLLWLVLRRNGGSL